jgi:hypothetical protein
VDAQTICSLAITVDESVIDLLERTRVLSQSIGTMGDVDACFPYLEVDDQFLPLALHQTVGDEWWEEKMERYARAHEGVHPFWSGGAMFPLSICASDEQALEYDGHIVFLNSLRFPDCIDITAVRKKMNEDWVIPFHEMLATVEMLMKIDGEIEKGLRWGC